MALTTSPLRQVIEKAAAELARLDECVRTREHTLTSLRQAIQDRQLEIDQAKEAAERAETRQLRREALEHLQELKERLQEQQHTLEQEVRQAADETARDTTRREQLEQELQRFQSAQEEAAQVSAGPGPTNAHLQVIRNVETKLEMLDKEEVELQAQLPAIQAQIVTRQTRIDGTSKLAAQSIANVQDLRKAYELAQTRAEAARGTPTSAEKHAPLKAQAKDLRETEKERDALIAEAKTAQDQETPLLADLRDEQERCQVRLWAIPQERQRLFQVKTEEHQEWGQDIRREVHAQLLEDDVNVALLEKQLRAAQEKRLTSLREGVGRLNDWPVLQPEFKQCLPFVEDDTYACLMAAHNYTHILLTRGRGLVDSISSPNIGPYASYWSLLPIPASEINGYEHVKGDPSRLRQHDAVLAQIAEDYKQLLQR